MLSHQAIHHFPVNIRQPEIPALELEGQPFVIDAQRRSIVALKS